MLFETHATDAASDLGQQLTLLWEALQRADAVLVGAGAGLSAAAGFLYDGQRFDEHFADFAAKYGFHDMYTGGFYPYPTQEAYWAYWSRQIFLNRYQDAPQPVYETLLQLLDGRDYFVLTTNVDHCFQKAGFDKQRLFYTQGDYGLLQCAEPCHQATYDNEALIRQMVAEQKEMRVPSQLLPKCPVCGKPMIPNLRCDNRFVEDAGWHQAAARYQDFLRRCQHLSVLYLELGVGYNTPGVIKYPFWQFTAQNPQAIYACINVTHTYVPDELADRAICIKSDIGAALNQLLQLV